MYKQKTGFFTKNSEALELKTSIFRISIKFWFRKHPQTFWPKKLNKTPVALGPNGCHRKKSSYLTPELVCQNQMSNMLEKCQYQTHVNFYLRSNERCVFKEKKRIVLVYQQYVRVMTNKKYIGGYSNACQQLE